MRFYRLEKINYWKTWVLATIRSLLISLLACIALLFVCGYQFMIVSSGSMEPALPLGSLIVIKPCDYEDLKLGDIVTMKTDAAYLTHRVVGKKIDGEKISEDDPRYNSVEAVWYTKGDANNTEDGAIKSEVVGTVSICSEVIGWIVLYVEGNPTLIIIMLVLIVAFVEALNYIKNKLVPDDIECYENDEE